ncbi:MAG: putative ABC transporter permease YknZ [Planctomycetes bacterium]|nr:putative ABC transporter permease YknZ [Planctomycetota bacterium]
MTGILRYHLLSLWVRRAGTALSVVSIGMAVGVLVLVLALRDGFRASLATTGREDNMVVLRQGATSEGESLIQRHEWGTLRDYEGVAVDASGEPLATAEIYAAMNLDKEGGGSANFPVRGVMNRSFRVRDSARITAGREFVPGTTEIVVGKALVGRVKGCRLGGALEVAGRPWPVVGVMDCGGGAYDSEIWCDVEVFMQAFRRDMYGTVVLRRRDPVAPGGEDRMAMLLAEDQRIKAKTYTEPGYFRSQTRELGDALLWVSIFLAGIMSVGAAFGTAVTMLASVAERRREIGTLLALGFRPWQVVVGFVTEALVLGIAGGAFGVAIAWPVNGIATGTMNWNTFTEQNFAFRISGDVVLSAVMFSSAVGVLAGFLPALRASRVPPSVALRG